MNDFGPAESLKQQRVLFDKEQRETTIASAMTDTEISILENQIKSLDKLLQREVKAKYKLEVHFGKGRTSRGVPFAGVVTFWLSGTKFHGGGDEKVYECPNKDCEALILPHQIKPGWRKDKNGKEYMTSVSICGNCGNIWESTQTIGERFFKLTEQNWAYAILQLFVRVEMNADIYLKYHPTDIRYKTRMEMARNRGGEELAKARYNRGLLIYPLKNIINDTKNGANLYNRIRKFINT
jgi:hypothetical protein